MKNKDEDVVKKVINDSFNEIENKVDKISRLIGKSKEDIERNSCKCKGINLLMDMTELYKWLGDKGFKTNQLDRERASRITDSLLKIVSENDVYSTDHANLWKSFLKEARRLNNECKEGVGEQCIYALENMRTVIHGDWGIRAKLLCDIEEYRKPPFSEENEEILKAMYALRGAFYGTPVDAINILKKLKNNLRCE